MNQGAPFFYNYVNVEDSRSGAIHAADNRIAKFFQRYLLQKTISGTVFDYICAKDYENISIQFNIKHYETNIYH